MWHFSSSNIIKVLTSATDRKNEHRVQDRLTGSTLRMVVKRGPWTDLSKTPVMHYS